MAQVVQSASRENAYHLTKNDSLILLSQKFPVSSALRQGLRGLDHSDSQLSPSLWRSLVIPDVYSSGRKTIDNSVSVEKNDTDDINMSGKSRKILLGKEGASGFCLENHATGITVADMIGGETLQKQWRDVSLLLLFFLISNTNTMIQKIKYKRPVSELRSKRKKYKKVHANLLIKCMIVNFN